MNHQLCFFCHSRLRLCARLFTIGTLFSAATPPGSAGETFVALLEPHSGNKMSTTASTPTEDPATGATADSRVYTPEYSFRDLVDEAAHPRNDTLTPKEHIVEGLKACPKGARPVVLYSCGSLCPVHRQHVRLQELAKECVAVCNFVNCVGRVSLLARHVVTEPPSLPRARYLEKHHVGEVHVVGGFLATSNDIYVRMKYLSSRRLSSFLEWDRRAELIRLALGLEGDKSPVADADALTGSCAGGATEDLRTSESASLRGQRKQHPFIRFDSWDGEPHKYFQEYFAAQASLQAHLDDWATEGERPRIHVRILVALNRISASYTA